MHNARREAWGVPSISPQALLEGRSETVLLSTQREVAASELKYTILDDRAVVFRNVHELAELYQATKKPNLTDLVSFRPERVLLQQTIAAVITRVQLTPKSEAEASSLEHDQLLQRTIKQIHEHILSQEAETRDKIQELYTKREEIEQILAAQLNGESVHSTDESLFTACNAALAQARSSIQNYNPGEHVSDYTTEKAILALATDIVYRAYSNQIMQAFVNTQIDRLASTQTIRLFEPPASTERELFMLAGGQASGKGGACALLRHSAEHKGISWVNISKGGADNFKKLLEPPDIIPELSDQLTGNEASYINWNLTKNRLISEANESRAPHIYSEQVIVSDDMIDVALINGGSAKIIMVSTKVEDAIQRAYARGEATGRFIPTQILLSAHRNSALNLPERIQHAAEKDVTITFFDNNVPKDTQPALIAEIDCLEKIIIIHDKSKFEEFIKKIAINIAATNETEVYHQAKLATVSIETYFQNCTDIGFTIEYPLLQTIPEEVIERRRSEQAALKQQIRTTQASTSAHAPEQIDESTASLPPAVSPKREP